MSDDKKIENGDVVVCIPGFGACDGAGAGYSSGLMFIARLDKDTPTVIWPAAGGSGVYEKAIRLATAEEKKYFYSNNMKYFCSNNMKRGTSINNMKRVFRISYTKLNGENASTSVESSDQQSAIDSIPDLKSVNYVLKDE